jgi:outer membrane protein assembly factor BamB
VQTPASSTSSAPAPQAQAASRPGAIITFLSGDVSTGKRENWQPAEIGTTLQQDDSVKVGPVSSCELQFGKTAMVHIGQNTTLALNSLSLEPQQAQVTIGLVTGMVACKVVSLATGEKFRVKTATAVMGVRGTEFVVGFAEGKEALLAVQKGEVAVLPPWAGLENLREKVKDSSSTLAPLEQQLEENARLVKADQQLVIRAETSRRWAKELAPIEQKINDLAAKADKGEEITRESVELVAAEAEKIEPSLSRSLGESTAIGAEPAQALATAASMTFLEIPAAAPSATAPDTSGLVGVSVTVQPSDAAIYVNGVLTGTGECSGIYAPGQKLEFRVVREGYQEKTMVITTEKGAPQKLQIVLEKGAEKISVRAAPPDAEIVLAGSVVGKGSYSGQFALGTKLSFKMRKEGFAERTLEITVAQGGPAEYAVQLEAVPLVRRFSVSKAELRGDIAISKDKLIVADANGVLSAATLKGKTSWSIPTRNSPNENSFPVVIGERVYFSGAAELVIADVATGSIVSRTPLAGATAHIFGQRVAGLPTTGIDPEDNGLRLFDLATGATSSRIAISGGSKTSPAVWEGKIVTVSQAGSVLVFDASAATPLAEIRTPAFQPVALAIQVVGNRGYFADRKGLVVCVDLSSGTVAWTSRLDPKGSPGVFQDLACTEKEVFAFAKNTLYGLSTASGQPLFSPISGVTSPPLCRGGLLYYGTDTGELCIADAATGKTRGSLDLNGKIAARPAWIGDLLVVGTASGEIIEINPEAVK